MASGAPRSSAQPGAKAATKVASASASMAIAPRAATWPISMSSKRAGMAGDPRGRANRRAPVTHQHPPPYYSSAYKGQFRRWPDVLEALTLFPDADFEPLEDHLPR